jgi:hypothetical protein
VNSGAIADVEVDGASAGERATIVNLFQLYMHDFSEFAETGTLHGEVASDGRFAPWRVGRLLARRRMVSAPDSSRSASGWICARKPVVRARPAAGLVRGGVLRPSKISPGSGRDASGEAHLRMVSGPVGGSRGLVQSARPPLLAKDRPRFDRQRRRGIRGRWGAMERTGAVLRSGGTHSARTLEPIKRQGRKAPHAKPPAGHGCRLAWRVDCAAAALASEMRESRPRCRGGNHERHQTRIASRHDEDEPSR